jgi:Tol biopolymer transport system component
MDGSGLVQILEGSDSRFPAWSPDGRYIASPTLITPRSGAEKWVLLVVNIRADTFFIPTDTDGREPLARDRVAWGP